MMMMIRPSLVWLALAAASFCVGSSEAGYTYYGSSDKDPKYNGKEPKSNGKKYDLEEYEKEMQKYFHTHDPSLSMPTKGKGKGKGTTPPPIHVPIAPTVAKGSKGSKGSKGHESKGKGSYSSKGKGGKKKSSDDYWSKGKGKGSKGKGMPAPTYASIAPQTAPTTESPTMMDTPNDDLIVIPGGNSSSPQDAETEYFATIYSEQYALTYEYSGSASAVDNDFTALTAVTQTFLTDFFAFNFRVEQNMFVFDSSATVQRGGTSTTRIFNTSVTFKNRVFPVPLPDQDDMREAVKFAFSNPTDKADYIGMITNTFIPGDNPFKSTKEVIFRYVDEPILSAETSPPTEPPVASPASQSSEGNDGSQEQYSQESTGNSTQTGILAGAVGAGVFAVLVGGLLIRRRSQRGDHESMGKFIDEVDGHVTVAGETFAGETHGSSITGEDHHNQQPQDHTHPGGLYRQSLPSSGSESSSVGASNWDSFQRNLNHQQDEPGMSPQEWDNMHEALSAGRPPSPPNWTASMLEDVMEEEHEDEFSYSEDSAPYEPGPMEDVRL